MFKKRELKSEAGFSVGVCLNRKATKGDVGIEIEVEGNKFPKPPGMEGASNPVPMPGWGFWSYVHDGSLRGKDNAEYVLTKPIDFGEVRPAIDQLYDGLKEHGSKIDDSNRTSVHVHLNCQNFHFNRLTSFMAIWFALEEVLAEWAGEHRVGNLFCLRAVDAPAIITNLRRFIRNDGKAELNTNNHYSGFNASALHKFGSIEIRFLRGVDDPEVIIEWVSILERLYKMSEEFPDPRQIPALFSQEGPLAFFSTILGDKQGVVRQGISWNEDTIRDSMYSGIRMAQDLCYCRDWDVFKAVSLQPDPFGRDPRRVIKSMGGMGVAMAASSDNDYGYEGEVTESPQPMTFAQALQSQQATWSPQNF